MSSKVSRILVALLCISGPLAFGTDFIAKSRPLANFTPAIVLIVLVTSMFPLGKAVLAARGTALPGAIWWATLAILLAILSQCIGLTETAESGRPSCGQWVYLSTFASLAAAISVLNARTPGSGAWAILMAILMVVFLVPWLEGGSLARTDQGWSRLRLSAPWTIFYGLLVVAGVTNFLATRYVWAATIFGLGLIAMFVGLVRTDLPKPYRGMIWEGVAWSFGVTIWVAEFSKDHTVSSSDLERLWIWFRDHWGVVWGLRTMERFNRTAEACDWSIRLAWQGIVRCDGFTPAPTSGIPEEATSTLIALLRRFADNERLNEVVRGSCPKPASV